MINLTTVIIDNIKRAMKTVDLNNTPKKNFGSVPIYRPPTAAANKLPQFNCSALRVTSTSLVVSFSTPSGFRHSGRT
jgi:hypothetical protein